MAYITPKTNWETTDVPIASDLNRIEGNIEAENTLLTQMLSSTQTFMGTKTFPNGIQTDVIDSISGNGVTIDSVTLKSGIIYGLVWGA